MVNLVGICFENCFQFAKNIVGWFGYWFECAYEYCICNWFGMVFLIWLGTSSIESEPPAVGLYLVGLDPGLSVRTQFRALFLLVG